MSGRSHHFLGITRAFASFLSLAQGHNTDAWVRIEPPTSCLESKALPLGHRAPEISCRNWFLGLYKHLDGKNWGQFMLKSEDHFKGGSKFDQQIIMVCIQLAEMKLTKLTEMKSTIAWALSFTVCTWAFTFSAAEAFSVTSANTASAFLEATANSFSFTASSLDSSLTDSEASTSFFKPR